MTHWAECLWKTPKGHYHSFIVRWSVTCLNLQLTAEILLSGKCKMFVWNWIRFSDVLLWKGRLFQTFDPYIFNLFFPKVTWFHSGVSRFNLYCSLTNLLFCLTLRILFVNSGFSLFIVLYISTHKFLNLFTLIFTFPDFSNKPSYDIE